MNNFLIFLLYICSVVACKISNQHHATLIRQRLVVPCHEHCETIKHNNMNIGDKAPEILGHDENGNEIKLSDFKGRKLVLYFYPKDLTSGCTTEACNLRDNYNEMKEMGYEVVGVSVDDGKQHQKFIAKNELPFHLIADTEKTLVEQFGVWGEKKMYGRTYMGTFRTTFIIDENGVIERIIPPKEIKVKNHAEQIIGKQK